MNNNNWIECKISYEKQLETGTVKKVTETYLVDAMSLAEAEARIIEEMTPMISGEFDVESVKKARIAELFTDPSGEKYYRCKVMFITLDEKSGLEKKTASTMIVQAESFDKAYDNLLNGMKGTISDWEINSIAESPILDIFKHEA